MSCAVQMTEREASMVLSFAAGYAKAPPGQPCAFCAVFGPKGCGFRSARREAFRASYRPRPAGYRLDELVARVRVVRR